MIYKLVTFLLGLMLILSCKPEKRDQPAASQAGPVENRTEGVQIISGTFNIHIPFNSTLTPWKIVDISYAGTTRLISQLVENGMRVKKGDLLASLWKLESGGEYTPMDIKAPIEGIVQAASHSINELVRPNETVMQIVNAEFLIASPKFEPFRFGYLKKGSKVRFNTVYRSYSGRLIDLDGKSRKALVRLLNPYEYDPQEPMEGQGVIELNEVAGTCIHRKYFNESDSILVLVEPETELIIKQIGLADSLALVYPPLPHTRTLKIIKKNFDLSY